MENRLDLQYKLNGILNAAYLCNYGVNSYDSLKKFEKKVIDNLRT